MHAFEYILFLLGAVLISNFISVRFPRIPIPLVQIALGVALTLVPWVSFEMHLEPELFMVLFIAPLLFDDAKKMDKPSLWRLKYPILLLALGLVFCTVLILGFAVNWFAPSIPLAAAFALAAALAPTDAVSVASLKNSAKISDGQCKLLQGESLLNDASSIVSFNFAIAAMITGSFSIVEAGGVFLIQFLGGLALGVALMLVRYASLRFLRSHGMDNISFHVLFEIITPFMIYLAAEIIHVNGIIAVVAAGIAHSFAPRVVTPASARLNVVSASVWSVIAFTLNGLVFLTLGTQLPYVAQRVWNGTAVDVNYLILFIVLILLVILVLRFIWILVMNRFVRVTQGDVSVASDLADSASPIEENIEAASVLSNLDDMSAAEREAAVEKLVVIGRRQGSAARAKHRKEQKQARSEARKAAKRAARKDKHYWKHHLFDALLLSLTGVKGAITLAVILSVPLTLGADPFPERDLLIFLASGVILLSLLTANIIVPLIAPKKSEQSRHKHEINAILDMYRKVIDALEASSEPGERAVTNQVVRQYLLRMNKVKERSSLELSHEPQVRRYVIELQFQNTLRLVDENKVGNTTALLYLNTLSHQLARAEHHNAVRWELKAFLEQFRHRWKTWQNTRKAHKIDASQSKHARFYEMHTLQLENLTFAVARLREHVPTEDLPQDTVDLVRLELEQHVRRLESRINRGSRTTAAMQSRLEKYIIVELRALDFEREAINEALNEGSITEATAKLLRDNVSIMELDMEELLD